MVPSSRFESIETPLLPHKLALCRCQQRPFAHVRPLSVDEGQGRRSRIAGESAMHKHLQAFGGVRRPT